MRPLDDHIKTELNKHIFHLEEQFDDADAMTIISPIVPGVDVMIRNAIEMKNAQKSKIVIILQTPGGVVEIVERIVQVIRNFYQEVDVIVPDQAMSAGTVLALGADRILMDYFSRLGPIDPQIFKDGTLVPALAYLNQYHRLNEKAGQGELTTAEYAMLGKLDLGELYQFEQARELSVELLIKWLSQYKFKDWKTTSTRKLEVTEEMKKERAKEIAHLLNDPERWHSHRRGIGVSTLRNELKLEIEDYSKDKKLRDSIKVYFNLLNDYLNRENITHFIHTKEYF